MNITKTNLVLSGIILLLLGIIYWQSGDEIITKTEIVYKIPETKTVFLPQTPKEVIKEIQYKDSIVYRDRQEPVNEMVPKDWLQEFIEAQDNSTKTLALYQNAIQLRTFDDTFEDDDYIVNLHATAFGKINSWNPTVTKKAKEITIPIDISSKPKVNYYAGGKLLTDHKFTKPNFEGSLYLQAPNGNMYTISMSTSVEQRYGAGYIFKFN